MHHRITFVAAAGLLWGLAICMPRSASGQSLRPSPTRPAPRAPAPPAAPATGQTSAVGHSSSSNKPAAIPVGDTLQHYITRLVIDKVPREYENTKKWGGTKKVMTGLDWEASGLKVETRRQFKEVNHGTWSRYKVTLVDPENTCEVRLENLRDLGDGRAAFDLVGIARLDCFGRRSEWRRGVQLVSISGEADAKVKLTAQVEVKMKLDLTTLPPDILLDPFIVAANVQLQEFELRRLGQADGPLVKQLGELMEEGVQSYLAENGDKLAEKMNKQLDKQRGKLRIPLSKVTRSPWGNWFDGFFESAPKGKQ